MEFAKFLTFDRNSKMLVLEETSPIDLRFKNDMHELLFYNESLLLDCLLFL